MEESNLWNPVLLTRSFKRDFGLLRDFFENLVSFWSFI